MENLPQVNSNGKSRDQVGRVKGQGRSIKRNLANLVQGFFFLTASPPYLAQAMPLNDARWNNFALYDHSRYHIGGLPLVRFRPSAWSFKPWAKVLTEVGNDPLLTLRYFCSVRTFDRTTPASAVITIDMVPVGNPGNAPDTRYNAISVGSVDHVYQIGKYEVTAGQYTEFLNAVAKADPNGLYNTSMGDPVDTFGANIQRSGSSPNYSYSVAADWANRPVNYVSFWDAARFANWLHNGQPRERRVPEPPRTARTTMSATRRSFGRKPGATFFIPTEDEWYKAAYHDKTAGLAASYSIIRPGRTRYRETIITETTNPGNNANYYINNYAIGSPYYRTVVGEFELSGSPYGTFDQGGNVWEWNETNVISSSRGLRGGSFDLLSGTCRRPSATTSIPRSSTTTWGSAWQVFRSQLHLAGRVGVWHAVGTAYWVALTPS